MVGGGGGGRQIRPGKSAPRHDPPMRFHPRPTPFGRWAATVCARARLSCAPWFVPRSLRRESCRSQRHEDEWASFWRAIYVTIRVAAFSISTNEWSVSSSESRLPQSPPTDRSISYSDADSHTADGDTHNRACGEHRTGGRSRRWRFCGGRRGWSRHLGSGVARAGRSALTAVAKSLLSARIRDGDGDIGRVNRARRGTHCGGRVGNASLSRRVASELGGCG